MQEHIADLAHFASSSPTSYHAAANIAERLVSAGFTQLDERKPWQSIAGKYFIVRQGAVVAWIAPEALSDEAGARIVGTHTDSPAFKVKPGELLQSAGWTQIGVEIYGGPLLNSWLDRDLGIAGRLVTTYGEQHLVQSGPICRIPQLAVHLDRGVNDALHLDKQTHLQPILTTVPNGGLLGHLAELAGVERSDVAFHDLYTFDTQAPQVIGLNQEFFASARLDNLACTHAALVAMERAEATSDVQIFAAFDHEEVGSGTTSGAAGPILDDMLTRIAAGYGLDADASRAFTARSSCVSADTGHLVHPNYPNHHDPVVRPQPNQGPLLKLNAQQHYASDAVGTAIWLDACKRADVPTQPFVSNNAMPCGTTIGPITATRLGITTVDVGVGLLSMHSARELCGVEDPGYLSRALGAYWAG
ncbi:M18 family aminopeptidase [uncultured Tessaracoccus sp.]|uniref:M18 family aminopeptidase n=1 Tax=uncultured Tessaracoccus sp. TaxID=905023 RepID=UPI0026183834|nr:M18 family aminopeptidase [uncultured Tessaracoccus sp.]